MAEGEYFYDATNLKKNINFKSKSKNSKKQVTNINFKSNEEGWFADVLPNGKPQKAVASHAPKPAPIEKKEKVCKHPFKEEKENLIEGDDLLDLLDF